MRLTVAICTWNRAAHLAGALDTLARALPPAASWEIIVVDNGSTDDTRAVCDRFAAMLPLRVVTEPALGLSNARNAAVAAASGDYIVWTDDDVLVDGGWLRAYEEAFRLWPKAAVFGGPIRPQFEDRPPGWLLSVLPRVADAFALRDFAAEPRPLDLRSIVPYGANFAVRMQEQRFFRYDSALGRRGRSGCLGEEIAVVQAILSEGGTGWWVPAASVSHWVPRNRQTVTYLRQYFELAGSGQPAHPTSRLRHVWPYIVAELKYRRQRLTGNEHHWIDAMIEASMLRGRLGVRRLRG